MRDILILFVHVIVTLSRLLGRGGVRSFVAESVLTGTALMPHCKAEHRIRTQARRGNLRISAPTAGNRTAAAFIKHPSRLDASKNPA